MLRQWEGAQEAVREQGQDSWLKLAKGTFYTIEHSTWCLQTGGSCPGVMITALGTGWASESVTYMSSVELHIKTIHWILPLVVLEFLLLPLNLVRSTANLIRITFSQIYIALLGHFITYICAWATTQFYYRIPLDIIQGIRTRTNPNKLLSVFAETVTSFLTAIKQKWQANYILVISPQHCITNLWKGLVMLLSRGI